MSKRDPVQEKKDMNEKFHLMRGEYYLGLYDSADHAEFAGRVAGGCGLWVSDGDGAWVRDVNTSELMTSKENNHE